ncbi:Transcriptional regulator, IclR family [Pseudomonas synxantha]|uniref:Transcriptional regulator, IclR family n=1 Tax=Pseudomonas synxantha TaxID=47883 RepID=A0A3G7U6A2_9PSED|nr:Transcriptional regulator, IclR family [Pseudomonas synxantha]
MVVELLKREAAAIGPRINPFTRHCAGLHRPLAGSSRE